LRDELAALVGKVEQDRAGLEQGQRLVAGAVRVEDGGNLVVGADRQEFRRVLVIGVEAHQVRFVRQAGFLEHDRDLDAIGRGQRIELDPLRAQGGPFIGNEEGGKIGHGNP